MSALARRRTFQVVKRENRALRRANEILGKASAYFVQANAVEMGAGANHCIHSRPQLRPLEEHDSVHQETGPSHVTGLGAGSNLISST